MITKLNPRIADDMIDCLGGSGSEWPAQKALRRYRRQPTEEHEAAALAAVNALPGYALQHLRAVARI